MTSPISPVQGFNVYISSFEAGMFNSIRSMTADMKHMQLISENVSKSGLPGF